MNLKDRHRDVKGGGQPPTVAPWLMPKPQRPPAPN